MAGSATQGGVPHRLCSGHYGLPDRRTVRRWIPQGNPARGLTFLQRVTPQESAGRITYRHLDDTDIAEIRNEIGEDEDGRLTLTLSITLTDRPAAAILAQNTYLRDLDCDFHGTLDAMTEVLRQVMTTGADRRA